MELQLTDWPGLEIRPRVWGDYVYFVAQPGGPETIQVYRVAIPK